MGTTSTSTTVVFQDKSWDGGAAIEITELVSNDGNINNSVSNTADLDILNVISELITVIIDEIIERVLTNTKSVHKLVDD